MKALEEIFANGTPTRSQWKALGEYLRRHELSAGLGMKLAESAEGTTVSTYPRQNIPPPIVPPFHPRYRALDPQAVEKEFVCWVTSGTITDRIPATTYTACPSVVIPDSDEMPIEDGQAVYVQAAIAADGALGACAFAVAADNATSTHYLPAVEDNAGSTATKMFKLAIFRHDAETGETYFDYVMAKSNIDHFRELPSFVSPSWTSGMGRVLMWFNGSTGKYECRALAVDSPLTLDESAGVVRFGLAGSGTGYDHLDLIVQKTHLVMGGGVYLGVDKTTTHYWRSGLYVGTANPDGIAGPPPGLIRQIVTHIDLLQELPEEPRGLRFNLAAESQIIPAIF